MSYHPCLCVPLLALLAGVLLAAPAARAATPAFPFSFADSPTQKLFYGGGDGGSTYSFTIKGGSGTAGLTLGTAKTIHVGSSELESSADFGSVDGSGTISRQVTIDGITQTITQSDSFTQRPQDEYDEYTTVDVQAGPTLTFDDGIRGRIDVTPQEYQYDTSTGAAPKYVYTLLLRSAAVVPSGVAFSPSAVVYPASSTATVTLAKAAPDAETVVLTSSNSAVASVPATVTVAAGQQTATFPIATSRVDSDTAVTISAAAGGTTRSAVFTVKTRPEVSFTYNIADQPRIEKDGAGKNYIAFSAIGGSGTVKLAQDQPYTITVGSYTVSNYVNDQDELFLEPTIARAVAVNSQTQTLMQDLFEVVDQGEDYNPFFSATLGDSPSYNSPTVVYDLGSQGRVELTAIGFDIGDAPPYYIQSETLPAQYTFTMRPPNKAVSLLVSPGKVYGGAPTYGRITLAAVAGTGGQTVTLKASDPTLMGVSASVVVPEGVKSAVFPIYTQEPDEDTPVTLTATSGGTSKTATLTLLARYQFSGTVKSSSSGLSGVTIGASSTGSFTLTSTVSPNAAIPDNSAAGLSTTLKSSGTGTITGLVVGIDITHSNIGDLRVTLKGPDGTTAVLYSRSGGSQQNILASYPVLRTPVDSLSAFNGKQVAGTWTLLVQDLAALDVGTLNGWNLTFTYQGTVTGSGTTSSDGTYVVPGLKEGTYTATPAKSGASFTPTSRSVTVGPTVVDPNPDGIDFARK